MDTNKDFTQTKECIYKNECYSVRDNGAVFRHIRENKAKRKLDAIWTFGILNKQSGYLLIGGERVHRIVALAFLGAPPTKEHVVDHIDTNKQNNRPENLRYLTKLENALLNPFTREKIIYHCGSIEAFLQNPKTLRDKAIPPNQQWMRAVSKEEAQNCLKNLEYLFLKRPKYQGKTQEDSQTKGIGEWIYHKIDFTYNTESRQDFTSLNSLLSQDSISSLDLYNAYDTKALAPESAKQRAWRTPSSFPLCPTTLSNTPLEDYAKALEKDKIFSQNEYGSSVIIESALTQGDKMQKDINTGEKVMGNGAQESQTQDEILNQKAIFILTKFEPKGVKPYALAKVTFENDYFIHESMGSYFTLDGAQKYFTLAQGLEWSGGDSIDDYC